MPVEMVLNELSHQTPAQNIYAARMWVSTLRTTIQEATSLGVQRILRTGRVFYEIELAPNYTVANWLHDNAVDREERRYLLTISTKYPYLEDFDSSQHSDPVELMECYYEDQRADGFRYAYWMEALALSFFTNPMWNRHIIDNLSLQHIDPETGELMKKTVSVIHASMPEHVSRHRDWIDRRIQDSVRDGPDIWYSRKELYPSLLFCDSVRQQLLQIHTSNPLLRQIKERLSELETFCKNWEAGPFDPRNLRGRPRAERQATLQQYGDQRTFKCPDGEQRVFSWHVSLNPGAWRLHFFPLENERKIIIGYIGPHLPTATEN